MLNWIDSVIPGTRSVRAPFIAGLLWSLLLWILLADTIPLPTEAEGWANQAYALAMSAGTIPTTAVIAVLIFVVGAIATTVSSQLAAAIGEVALRVQGLFAWHLHARRALQRLDRERSAAQRQIDELASQDGGEQTNEMQSLKKKCDGLHEKLEKARSNVRLRYFIRRTPVSRNVLGNPGSESSIDLEYELVEQMRLQALDAAIQDAGGGVSLHAVDAATGSADWESVERLRREFQQDPLDVLRVIDEKLFLELDRERAERDVRLAASVPLIAFGVLAWAIWTLWGLLLIAVASFVFVYASARQAQERSRVMNVVSLKRA